MEHEIDNQDEALEVIAEYLERLGVDGLRQQHAPDQINKSAVLRFLIAEKLQEAMDNPAPLQGQMKRVGQSTKKKRKPISFDTPSTKSRQ